MARLKCRWHALEDPHRIAVDSLGRVYVTQQCAHRIRKFDAVGVPQTSWGSRDGQAGRRLGHLNLPTGIAVGPGDLIYVTEVGNHRVSVFSTEGFPIALFGRHGVVEGCFDRPTDIAVAPDGQIFVADMGNHRVQVFGPNREFVRQWGGRGSKPGQFMGPSGIVLDGRGNVLVADSGNDRIQAFGTDGQFRADLPIEVDVPEALAVTSDGLLIITQSMSETVLIVSPDFQIVDRIVADELGGADSPEFEGVAVHQNGDIYLVNWGSNQVEVYTLFPVPA